MLLLLLLLTATSGWRYALVNAITKDERRKELIANTFAQHIYSENRNHEVSIYDGTQRIMEPTSSLQRDVIVSKINELGNGTCAWSNLLDRDWGNIRYVYLFVDSHYCDGDPLIAANKIRTRHVIVPIGVGPDVDTLQLVCIAGPCQGGACFAYRDYLQIP